MHKLPSNCASSESYEHADGLSDGSSQERPPNEKWRAGGLGKYKFGDCTDPSCNRVHDLNDGEICSFLHYLEQTRHVIFPDSSSETQRAQRSSESPRMEQHRCASKRLEYEDLQKSLRERFRGMTEAMLLTKVPRTPSGNPTSVGSVLHESGRCRPCRNMLMPHGCPSGVRCLFCHQEHTALSQFAESHLSCVDEHDDLEENSDKSRPERSRPSKAKRDQYKEMVMKLEADIHKDPFGWNIESVVVPPAIANKPSVKKKLLIRLALTADAAQSSHMRCSRNPSNEAEMAPFESRNPKKERSRQLVAL
eukprot:CAMPEP_0172674604 /NCGR_PEP_ID=MMETSP1074-20121228/12824_1 /TAXON_ID=2916 /ORGANISM="Ceratium fusus, Strain PA161109" /LENGTH=306 /DNA_ID=CAMNT_0013492027 /DNA_START=15 /DNA_END=935 /DNA_ORIENTATION=-